MNPKPMPQCFLANMGGKPYGVLTCETLHDEVKEEVYDDERDDEEVIDAIRREVGVF